MKNEQLLNITTKLISMPSISPNQAGAINYIEELLQPLGFECTRVDRNGTSNLIARLGTVAPIFAFAGHIDVVPTGDLNKWSTNPFELTEKDNKLYGRGIADMKGAVASFIHAVIRFLHNKHINNNGSIMLLITSDEEASATDGTILMVEYLQQQDITIDYCIIGEPSSVKTLGDTLKIGRRGSLTGYLTINGKQGHIAYPELCINPINNFANAFHELINTVWDNGTEYFPSTSLQFANINSGLGVTNVIPNELSCNFNFRYNTLHDGKTLSTQVESILNKHCLDYNIIWVNSAKPFYCNIGYLVKVITKQIDTKLNITTQLKTDGGTSDGRFLHQICREMVEFGLPNHSIHQIDEHINQEELYQLAEIYEIILNKIFNDQKNI